MTPLLDARSVSMGARLQPTDLQVDAGQLVAIIGPNGGGKTSLLRALAGVESSARGRSACIMVGGEDITAAPPARRRQLLSFLPASREVSWPIPVRDLIALGLDRPDPGRVEELIALLDLHALADRPIDRLSTGERARALLARALAPRPRMLLLDEPLSNLDPYWALRILDVLREVTAAGASVLVALHDLSLLERFDRALLIDGGTLVVDDTPATILGSPDFSRAFGIVADGKGWRISPSADRRSSL